MTSYPAHSPSIARRLDELAEEINDYHSEAGSAWGRGDADLGHYWESKAGEKLIEAKRLVRGGDWAAWLYRRFDGRYRTWLVYRDAYWYDEEHASD